MISVLVAEDERPIAKNIANTIQKTNPAFQVECVAYNGEQAMAYLCEHTVDVAFLDVNMPRMSGLDILQSLRNNGKETIVVILTGYESFEFARIALQNDAFDFLLKPLDKEQLASVLRQIQTVILKRDAQSSMLNDDNNNLHSCFFGVSYCIGAGDSVLEPELQKEAQRVQLHFQAALKAEFSDSFTYMQGHSLSSEHLLFIEDSCPAVGQRLQRIFEQTHFLLPFSLMLSQTPVQMSEIANIHAQYAKQLSEQLLFERSGLWFVETPDVRAQESVNKNVLQEVTNSIHLKQIIPLFIRLLQQAYPSRRNVVYLTKSFFLTLCEKLKSEYSYLDMENEIIEVLDNTYDITILTERMLQIVQSYFFWDLQQENNAQALALAVKRYIDVHFASDISSVQLSQKMGYDTSYVRKAFKDIYGILPSMYQVELRMQRAKKLLERNIPVKTVAQETGYEDPFYFSKVFKKMTGYTPKEYKNLHRA